LPVTITVFVDSIEAPKNIWILQCKICATISLLIAHQRTLCIAVFTKVLK
jgi:hypothetical protein